MALMPDAERDRHGREQHAAVALGRTGRCRYRPIAPDTTAKLKIVLAKSYRDQAAGTIARPLGVRPARPRGRVTLGRWAGRRWPRPDDTRRRVPRTMPCRWTRHRRPRPRSRRLRPQEFGATRPDEHPRRVVEPAWPGQRVIAGGRRRTRRSSGSTARRSTGTTALLAPSSAPRAARAVPARSSTAT